MMQVQRPSCEPCRDEFRLICLDIVDSSDLGVILHPFPSTAATHLRLPVRWPSLGSTHRERCRLNPWLVSGHQVIYAEFLDRCL